MDKLYRTLGRCTDRELKSYQNNIDHLTPGAVVEMERGFRETQKDIQMSMRSQNGTQGQRNGSRAAVRGGLPQLSSSSSLVDGDGRVGHVVDLACVSDEKQARLLSWAAGARLPEGKASSSSSSSSNSKPGSGGFMKAQVFASEKEAKRALKGSGGSYFALNRMVSARPQEEQDNDEVDDTIYLNHLSNGHKIAGRPQHLVNLLEMDPSPYDLRGTVFYNIFKDKIMMDSNKDAEKYIKNLVSERRTIPTIYTLREGKCYRGDGLVTAEDTLPAKLDFVFGEPKGEEVLEVDTLEQIKSGIWMDVVGSMFMF